MSYTVTAYKNTGFDDINIPDSPALLNQAEKITFDSLQILQNIDITTVRIRATFEEVENIDYVSIGEKYYTVNNILMLNANTCEIFLSLDYITSNGGIDLLEVEGGWLSRAHVANDALFENVLPEPFTPSKPLELKGGIPLLENSGDNLTFIQATVNIPGLQDVDGLQSLKFGEQGNEVFCPKLPPVETSSKVSMKKYNSEGLLTKYTTDLPNSGLYNSGDTREETQEKFNNIKLGLANGRSVGVESSVTAQYNVPVEFINFNESVISQTNQVVELVAYEIEVNFDSNKELKFEYNSSVKNKKVFSGSENLYILVSNCSGNKVEMNPEDIFYTGLQSPYLYITSDLRSTGLPYSVFKYYKRKLNKDFIMACKGLNWQNEPLVYYDKSGSSLDTYNFLSTQHQQTTNWHSNMTQGFLNMVGGAASRSIGTGSTSQAISPDTISNATIGYSNALNFGINQARSEYNYNSNRQRNIFNFSAEQNLVVPDVNFARDGGLRDFVGNNFILYRYTLSDEDIIRYDKFLTMYGYSLSTEFDKSYLTNRRYFNFIQASSVHLNYSNVPMRYREGAEEQLRGGVRIWHVLPDEKYYNDNPIVGGGVYV